MIKVDIYEEGRFKGTLRVKDRWHGIVPIDEEELREEIETRLPNAEEFKVHNRVPLKTFFDIFELFC